MPSLGERGPLLERDEVVGRLAALVAGLRAGTGQVLGVSGDGGLGKTAVLDVAAGAGEDLRVVRACGRPTETGLPFGLATRLFVDTELFPTTGLHRYHRELGEPWLPGAVDDRRVAVLTRSWTALSRWAESGPVLLVVDDLHWADPDSLALLGFLARRIPAAAVGLVCAFRSWPPPAHDIFDALVREGTASTCSLEPLSRRATGHLLGHATSHADDRLEERVWSLAGGNPLMIQAAARLLSSESGLPGPRDPAAHVERGLLVSLFGALPAHAVDCARAAAVLGLEFRPSMVPSVAGCTADEAADGLAVLIDDGLVRAGGSGTAAFSHPLVAHALLEDTNPARRSRLHARAFAQATELGLVAEAAHHAVAADLVGVPDAVASVRTAGRAALAAGAVHQAVQDLRAAAHLCGGLVPGLLRLELGEALLASGAPADAAAELLLALDDVAAPHPEPGRAPEPLTGRPRVQGLRLLTRALAYSGDMARADSASQEACARAASDAPELVALTITERTHSVLQMFGPGPARRTLTSLVPEGATSDPLLRAVRAYLDEMCSEDVIPVDRVLTRIEQCGVETGASLDPAVLYVHVAQISGRFDDEERMYRSACRRADRLGRIQNRALLDVSMVVRRLRCGQLERATAMLDDLERESDLLPALGGLLDLSRAAIACEAGEVDDAARLLAAVSATVRNTWVPRLWVEHLGAAVAFLSGDVVAAARQYHVVAALADGLGAGHPAIVPWAPWAVRAHLAAGSPDDAATVAERLRKARDEWSRHAALVAQASIDAAAARPDSARELGEQAAALLIPATLYRARALLEHGARERRANRTRTARRHLADALSLAEAAGASGLVRQVRAELAAAGGRRRRRPTTGLTAQEHRVAELAAAGLSNVEIAARLTVSVKTIETHLGRVFHKLDVRSRRQLRGHGGLDQRSVIEPSHDA